MKRLRGLAEDVAADLKNGRETQPKQTVTLLHETIGGVSLGALNHAVDAGLIVVSVGTLPLPVFTAVSAFLGGKLGGLAVHRLSIWERFQRYRPARQRNEDLTKMLEELEERDRLANEIVLGTRSVDEIKDMIAGESKEQKTSPVVETRLQSEVSYSSKPRKWRDEDDAGRAL